MYEWTHGMIDVSIRLWSKGIIQHIRLVVWYGELRVLHQPYVAFD